MKRPTFISREQLRSGALILVALVIVAVAAYKLGKAAKLFGSRYTLVAFVPNANGLRQGGSVTIAGQLAGSIERIDFLPPDADTTRNLRITVSVDRSLRAQVRGNSYVQIRPLGLLGDNYFDIVPGTLRYAVLQPGDTLPVRPSVDYQEVIGKAAGAMADLVALARDLREITGGLVRGDGTVGQLLTNRTLYDQLSGTLTRLDAVLARVDRSNGTVARLLDDPTLYTRLVAVTGSLDSLLRQAQAPGGTVGRLLSDDTLYTSLVRTTTRADSVLTLMTGGNGVAARLLTDQQLYDKLNKTLTDLNGILADLRRDPGKYTKGLIEIF